MTPGQTAHKQVGVRALRVDGREKLTGAARYVDDLVVPTMLAARLVRSEYAHAAVRAVDDLDARGLPGVAAVLSVSNVAGWFPGMPSYDPACHDFERSEPFSPIPGDARLFGEVVRYVGEPVAAVAAETDAMARRAASAIVVDYDVLPCVLDPTSALAPSAPILHQGATGNIAGVVDRFRGDPGVATAGATLVELQCQTSKQKQSQLEPTCCLARPEPDGGVTVWSPIQCPHRARRTLAHLFRLDISRVRIVNPAIGGAFGKGDALTAEPYAVALAMITQRPVKLRFDRNEDFTGTESRHPSAMILQAGFARDGGIRGLRARVTLDAGAYLSHSPRIAAVLANQLADVYRIPDADIKVTVAFTNTPVSGAFRGYGGPQAAFALEHAIDLGARAVGADPLEARVTMLRRAEENEPDSRAALLECIDRGRRVIGWDELRSQRQHAGPLRRGVGMACVTWKSGIADKPGAVDRSSAAVHVNEDRSVDVITSAAELGTGITTTLAQIVAEVLDVPLRSVRISRPDTAVTPFDSGAFASRSLYRAGRAVQTAAADAKARILAYAGLLLEVSPDDLELSGARIVVRGASHAGMDLCTLLNRGLREGQDFRGRGDAALTVAPGAAAQFAEVEVDVETGQVHVQRLVAAQDVGRAINPQIVEGQIEGALYQGLGYALSEELVVDGSTGTVLTGSFMDYRMPTVADGPRAETIIVEHPDPTGPFGAKGAGEPSIILTAPAIANAVLHATGASVSTLPMTPERVLRALQAVTR